MSASGFVVENLAPIRVHADYEELAGEAGGKPVTVAVTREGLFATEALSNAFAAEARKALALDHHLIARPLAIDAAGPMRWAIAWERFDAITLSEHIAEKGPVHPDEAVSLVTGLAQAVGHAHQRGVVHGSISADWVLVLRAPMAIEARLAGYGVGLLSSFSGPRKLAPTPVPSVDIAGLGAVLHVLLSGKPPSGKVSGLPAHAMHLTSVLTKALGLDLSNRFRGIDEFITALSEANRTRVSGGYVVPAAAHRTPVGIRTLGPWELLELLGEGAMGQVFLARHSLLGRQAAIKVLRPEQYQREDLIQRFFQEARSVNQINHEHIVEISDFGQEVGPDGKPTAVYFVMELLQGETLTARLARGGLPIERTVHIITQVASALAAAHRLGVVHRDVKTDNVFLINRAGNADYVKVLDFGVAKLTQAEAFDAPKVSTMDGAIIGTPTSMSPEQASGGTVDQRADVYAVGVLLYLMLAGKLPIDAENFGKLVALLLTKVPDPLPPTTPTGEAIPPGLADVVRRCLEKDPNKRPQSMDELIKGLTTPVATLGSTARTELVFPRDVEKAPERPRRRLVIGALVSAVAAATLGFWLWPKDLPAPLEVVDAGAPMAALVDAGVEEQVDAGAAELAVADAGVEEDEEPDAGAALAEADAGTKNVVVRRVNLTPDLIKQILTTDGSRAVTRCIKSHETTLKTSAPQGTIVVQFKIKKTGAMEALDVADPTPDVVKSCVKKQLGAVRFPPNNGVAGTIRFPYPYSFK